MTWWIPRFVLAFSHGWVNYYEPLHGVRRLLNEVSIYFALHYLLFTHVIPIYLQYLSPWQVLITQWRASSYRGHPAYSYFQVQQTFTQFVCLAFYKFITRAWKDRSLGGHAMTNVTYCCILNVKYSSRRDVFCAMYAWSCYFAACLM